MLKMVFIFQLAMCKNPIATNQWSTLPQELLSTIGQCLTTRTDLRHFRAVCTSWRSSIPLPPKTSPFSSLKIAFPRSPTCKRYFCLTESTIYFVQPVNKNTNTNTKSWLIKLEENPIEPDRILFVDPFTKNKSHLLPKRMRKTFNMLDYKVTEISKDFSICVYNPNNPDIGGIGNYNPEIGTCSFNRGDLNFLLVKKLVTSSTSVTDGDFMVFVILANGELGAWKMGDEMWTDIVDKGENNAKYDDVVFYGGKSKHFIHWKVYKLNKEKNDWVLVNGLGDQAFFVGYDNSFSVSARDFPGCKGNGIYFEDDFFLTRGADYPGDYAGIFDLENGSSQRLSAFPGYSKIFWPPPTWFERLEPEIFYFFNL